MTDPLRARIDQLVSQLEDFPRQQIARALVAKACDVSLADVGLNATTGMLDGARGLLAGHWTPETIKTFIEREI